MKKLLTTTFILLFAMLAQAQDEETREKIEAARIAFITERLELTPDQAEKFWPLYREYTQKRQELQNEFREVRGQVNKNDLTEEESKKLVELGLRFKDRESELHRTYSERLTRVITNRQLLQLRKTEDDFRRMLLQRLEKRREMQERMQQRKREIDN
jgi:hypothetical protein